MEHSPSLSIQPLGLSVRDVLRQGGLLGTSLVERQDRSSLPVAMVTLGFWDWVTEKRVVLSKHSQVFYENSESTRTSGTTGALRMPNS
jgi:hypothetical protein